jgi:tetratricopeptide (TPR) repeat protein
MDTLRMDTLTIGWEHHRAGRHAEADDACRRVLRSDPEDPRAWHLLGAVQFGRGWHGEAESSYRRALAVRSDFAAAHADLGAVLAIQGRLDEAVASLRRALALAPDSADAHNHLGGTLFRLGRRAEAVASLREAVRCNPDHPMAPSALGFVLSMQGDYAGMAEVFGPLSRIRPDHLVAHLRLGEALLSLGQLDEAKGCFEVAVGLAPDSPEAQLGLGMVLLDLGRPEASLPSLHRAAELAPDRPESQTMLARALRALGRLDEALDAAERALRTSPDDPQAYRDRGVLLDELRRCEEAIASYDEAIRRDPGHAETHLNRGVALVKLARYQDAIAAFDEALRRQPDYYEARGNRAAALLTLGDFERGWEGFEEQVRHRNRNAPWRPRQLWMGEPLEGRTILLHPDQGLGDTIQFIRYAPMLQARGARVVVACQEPLVRLAETCPGIDRVITQGDPLPEFDIHSTLTRVMCLITRSVEAIPAPIPYFRADPVRVGRWRDRLAAWPGFKVGIAWQGNPKHSRDRDRSFPLARFEELAGIEGVRLISLQRGAGAEQLRELGGRFPVIDPGEEVDPGMTMMEDTPAIMMGLDLVIAPDTAVAHLAGALGVPIWLALPMGPDWRWMLDRDDSPWYPTARLFRQTELGRWGPVFVRIAAALAERVAST